MPACRAFGRQVFGASLNAIYEDEGNGIKQTELPIYGGGRVGVAYKDASQNIARYSYELTDHLGNVRAVIEEQNGGVFVSYYADYYPFGWTMPERNGGSSYRYAYQGQEKDPETGWEAFELRMYDGRVGRWMTTDPYSEFHSPYLAMGNDPVGNTDPTGGIVDYNAFSDRVFVFFTSLFSKEFREQHQILKDDVNTWIYTATAEGQDVTIDLVSSSTTPYVRGDANPEIALVSTFSLNYNKSVQKNAYGKSKRHVLIEETVHAVQYAQGKYGMSVVSYNHNNVIGFRGNGSVARENRLNAEAEAWTFAIVHAPFSWYTSAMNINIPYQGNTVKVTTSNTLRHQALRVFNKKEVNGIQLNKEQRVLRTQAKVREMLGSGFRVDGYRHDIKNQGYFNLPKSY